MHICMAMSRPAAAVKLTIITVAAVEITYAAYKGGGLFQMLSEEFTDVFGVDIAVKVVPAAFKIEVHII